MNDHHTDALQVLSVLLHYPDEDLLNGLADRMAGRRFTAVRNETSPGVYRRT